MAETSTIEWTDATWNPVTGCSVLSPGCKHCYAMKLAGTRLQQHPSRAGLTIDTGNGPVWTGAIRVNEAWMDQPLRWRRPRRIFVCAHGDLFHEDVPDDVIDRVFAVMALAPQHVFQVLTKRAARMRDYLSAADRAALICDAMSIHLLEEVCRGDAPFPIDWPLPNVWLGVSVEDQLRAEERVPPLMAAPAAVRFVSGEPLLGRLDLRKIKVGEGDVDQTKPHAPGLKKIIFNIDALAGVQSFNWPRLDWVIAGGESGRDARPMHPDWARSLRDQCVAANVPFFFKQWGMWSPLDRALPVNRGAPGMVAWADGRVGLDVRNPVAPGQAMYAATKAIAGRLLDGVEHNGLPA